MRFRERRRLSIVLLSPRDRESSAPFSSSLSATETSGVFHAWDGKLSLSLNPSGSRVPSAFIQKSSLRRRVLRICSLVIVWSFSTSSITMIRKSRSKEWPALRKCWSIFMESGRFTSFRCLLILLLHCWLSSFPTYCSLWHLSHQAT